MSSPSMATARSRRLRRAAAGLAAMERRPVLVPFVVALAIRCVVAVGVTIGWGGSLFIDDATYSRLAQAGADGTLDRLGSYPEWLYEHTATLLVPISGLYAVLGPVKLAGQLYVVLLGALTAGIVARLALEILDRRYALAAGLIVALLPSQVLWSSIIMKDAAVWAVLAALALVAAIASRSTGRRLGLCAVAVVALAFLLAYLRLHSLEVALIALVLAAFFSIRHQRSLRVAGAIVLLVCVPYAAGMGVAGVRYVVYARDPGLQRALNAHGAATAVVDDDAKAFAAHPEGLDRQLAYAPSGVATVALRPWPWESPNGTIGVDLARAETLLWYPLLALAAIGLATAWPRRRALAMPAFYLMGIVVVYGLTEGNLGTAYRHRAEFVWALALLGTAGLERVAEHRRRREPERVRPQVSPT